MANVIAAEAAKRLLTHAHSIVPLPTFSCKLPCLPGVLCPIDHMVFASKMCVLLSRLQKTTPG